MKITVRCGNREALLECREGENLLSVLRDNGFNISASCGGRGICGKCRIKVFGGKYGKDGQEVLACKTVAENGICIELNEANGGGLTEYMPAVFQCDKENGYGVAVDIGTTTLAFALCELGTGKTIKKCARLNRQAAFGADVISRIMAAEEGKAELLAQTVRGQIEGEISELCAEFHIGAVKRAAVCGNMTMLHLFCGENVSGIGRYPFTPQFTEFRSVSGREFGISVDEIQVLPSVSAFVGADIVAGCVALDIASKEAMLADIGTNGEMIAHKGGKMFCTSTAAGPCFEGANIECGTGGVAGAVDSVWKNGKTIGYTTIGGGAVCGICGAGLVDAVALMLEDGVIDETGTFEKGDKFYITDHLYISQKDIRNFQLAKSAIYSGIRVLASKTELSLKDSCELYIAGGLGFYLNGNNARKTGILPSENLSSQHTVGDAALAGTQACMLSKNMLNRAKKLAKEAEYIDLSADAQFLDEYIQNMNFLSE